jgi:hypothetical protein
MRTHTQTYCAYSAVQFTVHSLCSCAFVHVLVTHLLAHLGRVHALALLGIALVVHNT